MEVLDHSENVTMNTCAHVLPQQWVDAADAIDELFGDLARSEGLEPPTF